MFGSVVVPEAVSTVDPAAEASFVINVAVQALALVARIDEHVCPASWRNYLAAIGGKVQEVASLAFDLARSGCGVKLKAVRTSAPIIHSVPDLSLQANGLLALPAGPVVDGVRRIATASIVVRVVGLVLVALVGAGLVGEVIYLPSVAGAVDGRALFEVRVPSGAVGTGRHFADPCGLVEERLVSEAFASIILFEVIVVFLAAGNAFF